MAFSINTNIASLQAQEYLRVTTEFQSKTINRVTSGLRIVSSGDDAAGLAIANGFRSDRAVLTQGVRNANDGLSVLQTIDGGINNISHLLDRARTLATQSASGTFTGDRSVLNSEFTSVLEEIDRQAQAIGLNVGGLFAKNMGVFIGGGRGDSDAEQIQNGSVGIDLSRSTVDTQSLGLAGYQAAGAAGTDIGNGNATTKVSAILADTTNTASLVTAGYTEFLFRGPGFSGANAIRVAVNLSGVTDPTTLVEAINAAIQSAGNSGSEYATAFENAGIKASILTDADGKQRLAFSSSTAAFQVSAGDKVATALLGKFESGSTGVAVDYSVSGTGTVTGTDTFAKASSVTVRVQGSSLASPVDLSFSVTTSTTAAQALTSLSILAANNSALQAAGITLDTAQPGSAIKFTSRRGEQFEVLAAGDDGNVLKLGSAQQPGTSFDYSSITGSGGVFDVAGNHQLLVSLGGGVWKTITITATTDSTASTIMTDLNSAIAQDADLARAGLYATLSGGQIQLASHNGTYFRISNGTLASTFNFGFGTTDGVTTTTTASGGLGAASANATVNSGGAYGSAELSFSPIRSGGDDQTILVSATDSSGQLHAHSLTLSADSGGTPSARTIDEAIRFINAQLMATNDSVLQRIFAVKTYDTISDTEKIQFLGSVPGFTISIGDNLGDTGITSSQGGTLTASQLAGGANADISTAEGAAAAVNALAEAVQLLGAAQAVVGKGQNRFNFAINLAQTQLNNLAASESRIRDADLAAEAANLTKAQILQQAGVAALTQANMAPQAVLSLLKG